MLACNHLTYSKQISQKNSVRNKLIKKLFMKKKKIYIMVLWVECSPMDRENWV